MCKPNRAPLVISSFWFSKKIQRSRVENNLEEMPWEAAHQTWMRTPITTDLHRRSPCHLPLTTTHVSPYPPFNKIPSLVFPCAWILAGGGESPCGSSPRGGASEAEASPRGGCCSNYFVPLIILMFNRALLATIAFAHYKPQKILLFNLSIVRAPRVVQSCSTFRLGRVHILAHRKWRKTKESTTLNNNPPRILGKRGERQGLPEIIQKWSKTLFWSIQKTVLKRTQKKVFFWHCLQIKFVVQNRQNTRFVSHWNFMYGKKPGFWTHWQFKIDKPLGFWHIGISWLAKDLVFDTFSLQISTKP